MPDGSACWVWRVENGELLEAAENAAFDVLVTVDRENDGQDDKENNKLIGAKFREMAAIRFTLRGRQRMEDSRSLAGDSLRVHVLVRFGELLPERH